MGKRGNKARQASRRSRENEEPVSLREYAAAKKRAEEQMALEDAYGEAERLGDFKDDGPPWEELEDDIYAVAKAGPVKEKEVKDAEKDKFHTTILKDHKLTFPQLGFQVYLNTSEFDKAGFAEMLVRAGCMKARDLSEADVCIFGGGPDVDPSYYGVTNKHPSTRPSEELDQKDVEVYYTCYGEGIPMIGICRGAQFLHVMNGGKLWQDVDNHGRKHPITDLKTGTIIQQSSSVHHQMCFDNSKEGQEIIAVAHVSRNRWLPQNLKDIQGGQIDDIEAFYYAETGCLGFQGHPEYKGFNYYTKWCLQQIELYILNNPDFSWRSDGEAMGYYRLRQELLDERDHRVSIIK